MKAVVLHCVTLVCHQLHHLCFIFSAPTPGPLRIDIEFFCYLGELTLKSIEACPLSW